MPQIKNNVLINLRKYIVIIQQKELVSKVCPERVETREFELSCRTISILFKFKYKITRLARRDVIKALKSWEFFELSSKLQSLFNFCSYF